MVFSSRHADPVEMCERRPLESVRAAARSASGPLASLRRMEPTEIQPVTSCLQSPRGVGRPRV